MLAALATASRSACQHVRRWGACWVGGCEIRRRVQQESLRMVMWSEVKFIGMRRVLRRADAGSVFFSGSKLG